MTLDVDAAMGRALELAAAAPEWGDTPIGAVVLGPDGAVLAEAANEREKRGDPTAHAEVLALRAAAQVHGDGWRLTGATLVVTLEPCTMCAGASVLARVARVVYGADDPKAGRGRVAVGRRPRPPAQPPARGHRRGAGRGVRHAATRVLPRSAGPVVSSAVACPSGRRSTPRKRVRATPSVGSNPTATASTTTAASPVQHPADAAVRCCGAGQALVVAVEEQLPVVALDERDHGGVRSRWSRPAARRSMSSSGRRGRPRPRCC